MSDRYTSEELLAKVEWEGGITEAIEYGVSYREVPIELRGLWYKAQQILVEYNGVRNAIQEYLDEVEFGKDDDAN